MAAIQHLQVAVELRPDETRYRYHLALAHHRSENWQAALSGYQDVLRQDPGHERAAYHLCLVCLQSGLELQPGGIFDGAFQALEKRWRDAAPPLPWVLRRLKAWRSFVRSGSDAELIALWGGRDDPAEVTVAPGARSVLALESALVALGRRGQTAARRLEEAVSGGIPGVAHCAAAVGITLAARAGHHRKAAELAASMPTDEDLGELPLRPAHRYVIIAARTRALWEAGLALWWRGERAAALPYWERARRVAEDCTALVHNVALAIEASGFRTAEDHWYKVARAWERRWQQQGKWQRPEYSLAVGLAYQRAGEAALARGEWRFARRGRAHLAAPSRAGPGPRLRRSAPG